MTDRLDLDEIDVETDEEPDANRGDWFWRGEGDPEDEPEGWLDAGSDEEHTDEGSSNDGDSDDGTTTGSGDGDEEVDSGESADEGADHDPIPGVPRSNRDNPVGVPIESGGAGATTAAERGGAATEGGGVPGTDDPTADADADAADDGSADGPATAGGANEGTRAVSGGGATGGEASGPHGGGADDMTMALTYEAAQRLADPRFAVIEAKSWTDWVGIVGDVPAYEINKFQRDHQIDADFFSGASQEPAERLADVDEHSMFYAERMVLVGVDGEEGIAERAGWEFVPLATAAEKADWDLADE